MTHLDRRANFGRKKYAHRAVMALSLIHISFIRQYRKQIAEAIKAYDLVTEINGGGNYRYKNDVWYPSDAMFEELLKCEVKMTVGLDAHSVDMLTSYYDASLLKLAKAGFKVIYYYEDGEWLPIKLNELI